MTMMADAYNGDSGTVETTATPLVGETVGSFPPLTSAIDNDIDSLTCRLADNQNPFNFIKTQFNRTVAQWRATHTNATVRLYCLSTRSDTVGSAGVSSKNNNNLSASSAISYMFDVRFHWLIPTGTIIIIIISIVVVIIICRLWRNVWLQSVAVFMIIMFQSSHHVTCEMEPQTTAWSINCSRRYLLKLILHVRMLSFPLPVAIDELNSTPPACVVPSIPKSDRCQVATCN